MKMIVDNPDLELVALLTEQGYTYQLAKTPTAPKASNGGSHAKTKKTKKARSMRHKLVVAKANGGAKRADQCVTEFLSEHGDAKRSEIRKHMVGLGYRTATVKQTLSRLKARDKITEAQNHTISVN